MTKRYVKLECSICARTRDSLINPKYYTPDKCTITLGCEGRLSPVGETSDGSSLIGVPPIGLQNWYARSSTPVGPTPLMADVLYDTSTGRTRQLIVAIQDSAIGFTPNDTCTLTLNLIAEQQQARDYRQYTYRKTGSFAVVNGVEDAVAKKVLRYTITGANPDQVEVYVDGVKRVRGTGAAEYQLYDGVVGSPVPPNSVLFNTVVTGVAPQVDVIVTKAATLSTLSLPLVRMIADDSRVGTGAWEGVDGIKKLNDRWSLFYCDFTEVGTTPVDVKLRLDPAVANMVVQGNTTAIVPPASSAILLSRTKLHTAVDRTRGSWAPLSMLTSTANYLVIKFYDGARQLLVTTASVLDVFPPLEVLRYNTPTLLRTGLSGNNDAGEIDSSITIGPDA
jgi:hypothetical protein